MSAHSEGSTVMVNTNNPQVMKMYIAWEIARRVSGQYHLNGTNLSPDEWRNLLVEEYLAAYSHISTKDERQTASMEEAPKSFRDFRG